MKKPYRYFEEEFKRNLITQIDGGAITKAQAARENALSPSLIDRWRRQIHEGTLKARPTVREKQLERELDQYKKKVGELTVQVDLLKKINEYSASLRKSNGYVVTGQTTAVSGKLAK
jgi:transposase-like protein